MSKSRLKARASEHLGPGEELRRVVGAVRGPWYPALGLILAACIASLGSDPWLPVFFMLVACVVVSRTEALTLALTDDTLHLLSFRPMGKIKRSVALPLSSLAFENDRISVTLDSTRYWIAPRSLGDAGEFSDSLAASLRA